MVFIDSIDSQLILQAFFIAGESIKVAAFSFRKLFSICILAERQSFVKGLTTNGDKFWFCVVVICDIFRHLERLIRRLLFYNHIEFFCDAILGEILDGVITKRYAPEMTMKLHI